MTTVPPQVLELARAARRITVLTGAGMSAESGVPTFRDAGSGIWGKVDPTELATPEAFKRDPGHVWSWYLWRVLRVHEVEPNAGHHALADWSRLARVSIVTQNVDDLHERAGTPVLSHLHGSLTEFRCSACEQPYAGAVTPLPNPESEVQPPCCSACGGPVRPGVVWFGEPLPDKAFDRAVQAVWSSDLVLSVGTSGMVHPAATLPELAEARGIPVVEVNPEETAHTHEVSYSWRTTAATGLPALVGTLGAAWGRAARSLGSSSEMRSADGSGSLDARGVDGVGGWFSDHWG